MNSDRSIGNTLIIKTTCTQHLIHNQYKVRPIKYLQNTRGK